MTEHTTPIYPTAEHGNWGQPPKQKKPSPFRKPIVWLPIVAAVTAFALGSGTASAQTIEVEKVVTNEVKVPGPERTVTKNVEVTPAACLTYITLSEQVFTISSDAMDAAVRLNSDGIDAQTQKLKAITPELMAAKSACRAG